MAADAFEEIDEGTPKTSGIKRPLLILFAVIGCGSVLTVIGGGALTWIGIGAFGDELCGLIEDSTVAEEHLGTIESCDVHFFESLDLDGTEFIVRVEGSLASGLVIFDYEAVDTPGAGVLELDSGESYDFATGERVEADRR